MKFNNKVLEVWAKWAVGNFLTAAVVIGKFPTDFTSADWKHTLNTVWLAFVPVVLAWANPKNDLTLTIKK